MNVHKMNGCIFMHWWFQTRVIEEVKMVYKMLASHDGNQMVDII